MATARVLCIGTELTRGEIVNTNANFLAAALTRCGFLVVDIDSVDDDPERIATALRLGGNADVLVCTGGLGPTTDDITTVCVANELGVPLERDAASLEAIRARIERFGRTMSPGNEKQADFPKGGAILPNPNGTAPGFSVRLGRARAFFMPGVPREMWAMFENHVAPAIADLVDETYHQISIKTYGLPESEVNDKLRGVEETFSVTLGYRASFPIIEVKVLARDLDRSAAERRARAGADEVVARLGTDIVYGEGDVTFAQALGRALSERGLKIAAAESCTGGLVGELLTARGGSSEFFLGSAVTYDDRVKTSLLGVPPELLRAHGAVSREVARAMAEGALAKFEADIAIGITGIAGPGGATADKPVGLVYYAAATRDGTTDKHFVFAGDRDFVRLRAAYAALGLAYRIVRTGSHDGPAR